MLVLHKIHSCVQSCSDHTQRDAPYTTRAHVHVESMCSSFNTYLYEDIRIVCTLTLVPLPLTAPLCDACCNRPEATRSHPTHL